MDDVKPFVKKWKRIGESDTNDKNLQQSIETEFCI